MEPIDPASTKGVGVLIFVDFLGMISQQILFRANYYT